MRAGVLYLLFDGDWCGGARHPCYLRPCGCLPCPQRPRHSRRRAPSEGEQHSQSSTLMGPSIVDGALEAIIVRWWRSDVLGAHKLLGRWVMAMCWRQRSCCGREQRRAVEAEESRQMLERRSTGRCWGERARGHWSGGVSSGAGAEEPGEVLGAEDHGEALERGGARGGAGDGGAPGGARGGGKRGGAGARRRTGGARGIAGARRRTEEHDEQI